MSNGTQKMHAVEVKAESKLNKKQNYVVMRKKYSLFSSEKRTKEWVEWVDDCDDDDDMNKTENTLPDYTNVKKMNLKNYKIIIINNNDLCICLLHKKTANCQCASKITIHKQQ